MKFHRADWWLPTPPPPLWAIDRILPLGAKGLFAGESTAGKTWLLAEWALCCSLGAPWLGKATMPLKVAYINRDAPAHSFRWYLHQLCKERTLGNPDSQLWVSNADSADPVTASMAVQAALKAGFDPDLVIMETMLKINPNDINDNVRMAQWWNAVGAVLEPPGRAPRTVVVSHHWNKWVGDPSMAPPSRMRIMGAAYLMGGADTVFTYEREDDAADWVDTKLTFEKSRFGREPKPMLLRRHGTEGEPVWHEMRQAPKSKSTPAAPKGTDTAGHFGMPAP